MNKNLIINYLATVISICALSGCAKNDKRAEQMSADELKTKITAHLNSKRSEHAIEFLEQMIEKYSFNVKLALTSRIDLEIR